MVIPWLFILKEIYVHDCWFINPSQLSIVTSTTNPSCPVINWLRKLTIFGTTFQFLRNWNVMFRLSHWAHRSRRSIRSWTDSCDTDGVATSSCNWHIQRSWAEVSWKDLWLKKWITLLRVIPTMTFIDFLTGKSSGILSDISSGISSGRWGIRMVCPKKGATVFGIPAIFRENLRRSNSIWGYLGCLGFVRHCQTIPKWPNKVSKCCWCQSIKLRTHKFCVFWPVGGFLAFHDSVASWW